MADKTERFQNPYVPLPPSQVSADLIIQNQIGRAVWALDYIAAQLGEINRKLPEPPAQASSKGGHVVGNG